MMDARGSRPSIPAVRYAIHTHTLSWEGNASECGRLAVTVVLGCGNHLNCLLVAGGNDESRNVVWNTESLVDMHRSVLCVTSACDCEGECHEPADSMLLHQWAASDQVTRQEKSHAPPHNVLRLPNINMTEGTAVKAPRRHRPNMRAAGPPPSSIIPSSVLQVIRFML